MFHLKEKMYNTFLLTAVVYIIAYPETLQLNHFASRNSILPISKIYSQWLQPQEMKSCS